MRMSPYPPIGQWMRAADLCDGVSCGYETFTITWKDGEVVDEARIEEAKLNLKKAIEDLYYDCYSIETIRASGVKCGQTTDPPAD